jgi:uncharacterized protein YbjT (DUF2867 family)
VTRQPGSALVTGATGMQGGAVARALHRAGVATCAMVRDPDAPAARELAREGVALVRGDLDDPASLTTPCEGRTTVFSVQPAPLSDQDSERRQAANLVAAARAAGVGQLVHTSVSGTGWRASHPDVDVGPMTNYWDSKEDAEVLVREAGIPAYTILKPAFFMENFIAPKARGLFPRLSAGELVVVTAPSTLLGLVAADDLGAAVAAIVANPERFASAEIELGGDALTFPEIADALARASGRPVVSLSLPQAQVEARLGRRSWTESQAWLDAVGYPARPQHAAAHGLSVPTTFARWVELNHEAVRQATTPG